MAYEKITEEFRQGLDEMVADFIEMYLDDNKKRQIRKALKINKHLTSTYALQVREVQDIHGDSTKRSGWYVMLEGTRCGVNFFINNDFEITRKPRGARIAHRYSLYNDNTFSESFWIGLEW